VSRSFGWAEALPESVNSNVNASSSARAATPGTSVKEVENVEGIIDRDMKHPLGELRRVVDHEPGGL
jgi:hypothetical protein